jgi:hypothetical protein
MVTFPPLARLNIGREGDEADAAVTGVVWLLLKYIAVSNEKSHAGAGLH